MRLKLITAAAAIAAATSAQAADLGGPPPPAVDYVRICDAYGTGFFYIPGTETCLKVGGYVFGEWWVGDADRLQTGFRSNSDDYLGLLSWDTRNRAGTWSRVRGSLTFDARTNTEYGLLRSVIEVWHEVFTPVGTGAVSGSGAAGTNLRLWQGFIQFGGLVAGRTESFFSFWTGYTLTAPNTAAYSFDKVNLLAYQFAFGNGVSATISIEDPTTANPWSRRRDGAFVFEGRLDDTAWVSNPYGGHRLPDLVGNIRVDQAWGAAQIMGALRQNIPQFGDKELGFAVGGGLEINIPMIAAGDKFVVQASYSEGALSYTHATLGAFAGGRSFLNGALAGDYVVTHGGELHQTTAWAVAAGFRHMFTQRLQFNVQGSYTDVDGYSIFDLEQIDVNGSLVYTIVPGMSVSVGLEYRDIDLSAALNKGQRFGRGDDATFRSRFNDADDLIGSIRFLRVF